MKYLIETHKKARESGNGSACYYLGRLYEYGKGMKKDLAKAIEFYRGSCGLGSRKGYENYQRCLQELEEKENKKPNKERRSEKIKNELRKTRSKPSNKETA